MKAIQFSQFGGRDVLEYVEVAKPLPQADDDLLIEVTGLQASTLLTSESVWESTHGPRRI